MILEFRENSQRDYENNAFNDMQSSLFLPF